MICLFEKHFYRHGIQSKFNSVVELYIWSLLQSGKNDETTDELA